MASIQLPPVKRIKSRLLPLPLAVRFLERLIEMLPRRRLIPVLEPSENIVIESAISGEYRATGISPRFDLSFKSGKKIKKGWYYLELAITHNNGCREMHLHADFAGPEISHLSIPVPCNIRGTVREVFYLPQNAVKLSWQPTSSPGFFAQSGLLLHRISGFESYCRRLYRVFYDLCRFRKSATLRSVGLRWWSILRDLHGAYQSTALLRIKRIGFKNYSAFILHHDQIPPGEMEKMRKQVLNSQLPQPQISIIMTLNHPEQVYFQEAVESVMKQAYPYWELLLVVDHESDRQGWRLAADWAASHGERIRLLPMRRHDIPLADMLNEAVGNCQGGYVLRLGQHDRLPQHALCRLVLEMADHPDAAIIYTDHDYIDEDGERLDPSFKPDWNQELFFTHDYIADLCLYRVERLLQLGGYRARFSGAEDYDLKLRYLSELPESQIRHIPKILYHTRLAMQATEDAEMLQTAHQAARRALRDRLKHTGIQVEQAVWPGFHRVRYPLPPKPPLVSIIIPTRDRVEILRDCVESVRNKTGYSRWEMLVVDNQSIEADAIAYLDEISRDPRIRVLGYDQPFNYSAINNFAVSEAKGEILALLNNDIEVIAGEWLEEMVSYAIRDEIGAVGAKLLYSNGNVQHAGVILGVGGVAGHGHKHLPGEEHGYGHRAVLAQNLSAVTGACLVVRKSCYLQVNGLDEENLIVALNDIDFCLKLRDAGYKNIYTPHALLYHHESYSRGRDDTPEKQAVFKAEFEYMQRKWAEKLLDDPAYNPNLTLEFESFSLRTS